MRALLLSVVLILGACSSSSTPPATPSPTATGPTASAAPDEKLVDITIHVRSVSPPPGRIEVAKDEKVKIVVHSDTADEIHLHGYDIEKKVGPGEDAVIEFVATQTGVFELETHESGLLLTQLAVR